MPTNSAIRKSAADLIKKMMPQGFSIAGIILMISALNVFVSQIFLYIIKNRTIAVPVYSVVNALLVIFLTIPMILGVMRFFWRQIAGADDSVASVFYFFSTPQKYRRSLSLIKNYLLRVYLFPITLYILTSAVEIAERTGHGGIGLEVAESIVFPLLNTLIGIGIVVSVFLSLRYFLAPYIMFNDEGITPGEAMLISYRITRRRSGKILGFLFGFIGWAFLSTLILPIFYTMPLIYAASAVFARYMIEINNFEIDHGRRIF